MVENGQKMPTASYKISPGDVLYSVVVKRVNLFKSFYH